MHILGRIISFFLFACFSAGAHAQSSIELELSSRGFVEANILVNVQASTTSDVSTILLPFRLSSLADIRTADNIHVSVMSDGDDFTLLAVLHSANESMVDIKILNAIELEASGSTPRVKLELDFTYSGFQQHATLRSAARSRLIDDFDLEIALPSEISEDDLSFKPRSGWVTVLPLVTIESSANSNQEVFVAFSNPYRDSLWLAQIVIGAFAGAVLTVLSGKSLVNRTAKVRTLLATALLTAAGIGFALYFFNTLIEPLSFLAWLVGLALTWPIILIASLYYAYRKTTDAEVVGNVQILNNQGNQPARFVKITISDSTNPSWSKNETVDDQGRYTCFVYCAGRSRELIVSVTDPEFTQASSGPIAVSRRDQKQIDPIVLTRVA